MLEVSGTFAEVKAGDVMVKGTVSRVAPATRSRAGRMLMVIEFDHGTWTETWVVDPEGRANWKRPE